MLSGSAPNPGASSTIARSAADELHAPNELREWLLDVAGISETRVGRLLNVLDDEEVDNLADLRMLAGMTGGPFDTRLAALSAAKIRRAFDAEEMSSSSPCLVPASEEEPQWLSDAAACLASTPSRGAQLDDTQHTPPAAPAAPSKAAVLPATRAKRGLFGPIATGTRAATQLQRMARGRLTRVGMPARCEAVLMRQAHTASQLRRVNAAARVRTARLLSGCFEMWRATVVHSAAARRIQAVGRGMLCRRWAPRVLIIPTWFWVAGASRTLLPPAGADRAPTGAEYAAPVRGDGPSDAESAPELIGARTDGGGGGATDAGLQINPPQSSSQHRQPITGWGSGQPAAQQTFMRFDGPSSACGPRRAWQLSKSKAKISGHMLAVPDFFRVFRGGGTTRPSRRSTHGCAASLWMLAGRATTA